VALKNNNDNITSIFIGLNTITQIKNKDNNITPISIGLNKTTEQTRIP
jgi:hypothetical protein